MDASLSRRHHYHDELEEEAAYYNRKALERGYPGEAYNGATRDWALVDVPPGTERVRMDGAGGGAQEITWQRYNGVRRSKFMSGGREFDTGYGESSPVGPVVGPTRPRAKDMWTEVTKDLVVKDAIEALGYEYEETDAFFYVMEYLRYVSCPTPTSRFSGNHDADIRYRRMSFSLWRCRTISDDSGDDDFESWSGSGVQLIDDGMMIRAFMRRKLSLIDEKGGTELGKHDFKDLLEMFTKLRRTEGTIGCK